MDLPEGYALTHVAARHPFGKDTLLTFKGSGLTWPGVMSVLALIQERFPGVTLTVHQRDSLLLSQGDALPEVWETVTPLSIALLVMGEEAPDPLTIKVRNPHDKDRWFARMSRELHVLELQSLADEGIQAERLPTRDRDDQIAYRLTPCGRWKEMPLDPGTLVWSLRALGDPDFVPYFIHPPRKE